MAGAPTARAGHNNKPVSQLVAAIGFGLVTASILALGSVGFTLQFGITNIFNVAYGDVMTVGAFVAYVVNVPGHQNIWLAMAAAAGAGAILSALINQLIYAPFLRRGTSLFTMVMVSLAVSVIAVNIIQVFAGAGFYGYTYTAQRTFHFLGMLFTATQLAIIGISVGTMILLHVLLTRTRLGKAMRATAVNASLARSCGISTDRVTAAAWLISGALCGLAGSTLALNTSSFDTGLGSSFLLIVIAAAVFGGVGRAYGAMLGALVVGVASEVAALITPDLKQVAAFVLLCIMLLYRPNGLLRATTLDDGGGGL
jgi:branched-chain amino acid transport system permease protein/neutral amino acid transport system permease protein